MMKTDVTDVLKTPTAKKTAAPATVTTGPVGRIAIVGAQYNADVTDRLVEGAVARLKQAGLTDAEITVVRVPGAWELPLAAKQLLDNHAGVVALGAVIRGETTHDEHINRTVSDLLGRLAYETGKPVGFGLLTCLTMDQAVQRAGGRAGNKGDEAADAVLAMLELRRAATNKKDGAA